MASTKEEVMKSLIISSILLLSIVARSESIFVVYWTAGDASATISMQAKTYLPDSNEMKTLYDRFNDTPEDVAGRVLIKEYKSVDGDVAFMCRYTKLIQHYQCAIDVFASNYGKISKAEGYISYYVEGEQASEFYKIFNRSGSGVFTLTTTDGLGKQLELYSGAERFSFKYTEKK